LSFCAVMAPMPVAAPVIAARMAVSPDQVILKILAFDGGKPFDLFRAVPNGTGGKTGANQRPCPLFSF